MTVDSKLPAASAGLGLGTLQAKDTTGLLFGRLTVLPALLTLPFLLTSFPLLLLGWFKPLPVIVLYLLAAAVIVPPAWRRIPSLAGAPSFGTAEDGQVTRTPRWPFIALIIVTLVYGLWQAAYHSQQIIIMLDPASYMMFADWIANHGSLPIAMNAQAFGHAPNISFASAAFYQSGNTIVPQFMAGLPMILSLGFWAGGMKTALFWGPVLGTVAVFMFGGLAARLIGPRWAPFAALTLGITIPQQYTSRSTFSESLAQVMFFGALSLWIDTQRVDRGEADAGPYRTYWRAHAKSATHVLALITGLLFGITLLVRIDGPSDILLLIPYCGMLALTRQRKVLPLVAGTVIGLLYGAVDCVVLTRPYVETNWSSVKPMTEAFIGLTVLTAAAVWYLRRRKRPFPYRHPWVLRTVTVLPFLVLAVFAIRPYVERNWHALQDAPLSLHWIYWYTGGPIIAFAAIAAAFIARRCVKGEARVWVLPLLLFGWCIFEFLLRPAITPHQPWASRRLVPAVLPGLILLSIWLVAWMGRKARVLRLVSVPRYLERLPRQALIGLSALLVIMPPAIDTFGLRIESNPTTGALQIGAQGLAFVRTYSGEISIMDKLCAAIPGNSSVLIVDNTTMQEFGEDIRDMCAVPVAQTTVLTSQNLAADVHAIEQTGRHPLVLAPTSAELAPLGNGIVKWIMTEYTYIDEHIVFGTPHAPVLQKFAFYSWEPSK